MRVTDSAGPPVLVEENIPQPKHGPGEILVRGYAAGVTPTEMLWYPTSHKKDGGRRDRAIPGHEFSAVIASAGEQNAGFQAGQGGYRFDGWVFGRRLAW